MRLTLHHPEFAELYNQYEDKFVFKPALLKQKKLTQPEPGKTEGAETGNVNDGKTTLWNIDRENKVVKYKEKSCKLAPRLFVIFETLYDKDGKPITFNSLFKEIKRKLGYNIYGRDTVRDWVVDLKNALVKDLEIDRDLMEKIIKKKPSTGKIKTFTFHKNL